MEPTQEVAIGVDAIFASHIGIFGNTGSRKSYTLAKIYHELFEQSSAAPGFSERAQFLLIDFNGEYVDRIDIPGAHATEVIAGFPTKKSYVLATRNDTSDKLPLPKSAVHDPLFWTVLLDATEKTQAPFISRVLTSDYWDNLLPSPSSLLTAISEIVCRATRNTDPTVDRQLSFNFLEEIHDCLGSATTPEFEHVIQDLKNNLHFNSVHRTFYWSTPRTYANADGWDEFLAPKITQLDLDFTSIEDIDLVRFKIVMQYYRDIISGYSSREHLGPLVKRMNERVPSIKN
ncbi:hypothetical protein BK799_29670 [Rhodococcus sp. D-1]|nr:hypothetical protein BK799_29670 [Rhodococcus sp. D-1]